MAETRTHNGITYTSRPNAGDPSRIVWEGGRAGGTIFVSSAKCGYAKGRAGLYGSTAGWYETFEEAADVHQERALKAYQNTKAMLLEFEAGMPDDFEGVQRSAFVAGYEKGGDDAVYADKNTPIDAWHEHREVQANG